MPSWIATVPAATALSGPSAAQDGRIEGRRGQVRIVVDTDAANYFDDQFAIAYAALSREAIEIEALCAAPFTNQRVSLPEAGMERSYEEIGKVLGMLGMEGRIPVLEGSRTMIEQPGAPVDSPAARDIVERAMRPDSPVDYIVSIGAATNVASALLMEPEVGRRTTVVWLGGTPYHFPSASEFNLRQDPHAVRTLFDAGARLVHFPAPGLAENLRTTREEVGRRLRGTPAIGSYLAELFLSLSELGHSPGGLSRTMAIWDLAPVAWLVNPEWVESVRTSSPSLSEDLTWHRSPYRHGVRVATRLARDEIFTDLFGKLGAGPA